MTELFIYLINRSKFDFEHAKEWLLDIKWTPELVAQWQEYYNTAPRLSLFIRGGHFESEPLGILPKYQDLKPAFCANKPTGNAAAICLQKIYILLPFFLIFVKTMFIQ
jgi:hypothetical protein